MIKGKIIQIVNHFTVYRLLIQNTFGRIFPIVVDHRCFGHIVEGEGNIFDREVEFDDNTKTLRFINT